MFTIGLTGGIGSGKSTVSRWFKDHDVPVFDADLIVHELLAKDQETIELLSLEFGTEILAYNGGINRRVLGQKVFADPSARNRLEGILHPQVLAKMKTERMNLEQQHVPVCIWDIPLLYEAKMHFNVNEVWVVWVPVGLQIQRVLKRDKLTEADVMARIQAQMPLDEKKKLAEVVIDNSGTWQETLNQLEEHWIRIKQ